MLYDKRVLSLLLLLTAISKVSASDDTCGARSLSVCCARLGVCIDSDELERMAGSREFETSLLDLTNCAAELDLVTIGLEWAPGTKPALLWDAPGIARIYVGSLRPHFVALVGMERDQFLVVDYPNPPTWISEKRMRESLSWNGSILHVALDADTIRSAVHVKFSVTRWGPILAAALLVALWNNFRRQQPKGAVSHRKELLLYGAGQAPSRNSPTATDC